MSNHWQAPGNGNIFDCDLCDWEQNKMSQRSIGILQFIHDYKRISKENFERNVWEFLDKRFGHEENKSTIAHFYRPLEFAGLIRRNEYDILDISKDGRRFLYEIARRNYDTAKNFYILQLMKVRYPNSATPDVKLKLFPFRIMFKLLKENGKIPYNYFVERINYINKIEDIVDLFENSSKAYRRCLEQERPNDKWKAWIISYLLKWNILSKNGEFICLSDSKKDFIASIVDGMSYKDMFFDDDEELFYQKNAITKVKRDPRLIRETIQKHNYKCFFNENHITFETVVSPNYLEGHHIIPISLQGSYEEELDTVDNIIPLCPVCHRAIHLAKNEHKKHYLELIYRSYEEKTKLQFLRDFEEEDLKEIYYC